MDDIYNTKPDTASPDVEEHPITWGLDSFDAAE